MYLLIYVRIHIDIWYSYWYAIFIWYSDLLKLDFCWKVGWSPVTQGRSTECPPRRRRGARVADSSGGVGGAECDLEMLRWRFVEGNFSKMYQHTRLYVLICCIYIYILYYTYLFIFQLIKFYILKYSHYFWSWCIFHVILFTFQVVQFFQLRERSPDGNLHLWGGCAKNHRLLKKAWKNDGFIVSSTYFCCDVFF